MVGHHKGGVEAHAELADDIDVLGLVLLGQVLLELEGAALGDGARLLSRSSLLMPTPLSETVRVRISLSGTMVIFSSSQVHRYLIVGKSLVGQLVFRIAGVGDELPEEDLLVGVDGVDHQVQQALGFCLKLFLCHDN